MGDKRNAVILSAVDVAEIGETMRIAMISTRI
jgi:hypothetical protein